MTTGEYLILTIALWIISIGIGLILGICGVLK